MAAKKFFVDLDLQQQALKNAKLENRVASGSGVAGQVAFDTVSNKMAFYNGTSWETVGQLAVDTVNYKGGIAYNAAAPSTPDQGDMYIFTSGGTNNSPWWRVGGGAEAGGTVQAGDFVIYDGTNWDVIQKNIEAASESVAGYVRLADDTETNAGTENAKAVSPKRLADWANQANKTVVRKRTFPDQDLSVPRTLTHQLGNDNVMVSVYDQSTSEEVVVSVVKAAGTVTVSSNITFTATVVISA
jgi:hypothetical protein